MAIGPIDYSSQMVDPFQGLGQFVGLGGQIRAARDQRAKQEQEAARQEQYQTDIAAAMKSPNPQAFAALALKYPQHREAFKQGWEGLNTEQQQNELRDATTLAAALQSGRPDVALRRVEERLEAMKASGQQAPELEFIRDRIKTDPQGAYGSVLHVLSALPGSDKVLENLGRVGAERRADQLQPSALAKSEADAAAAGSDATTKAVAAKYAEPMTIADLKKKGADLNLTNAQIGQAIALTSKHNAETQKAVLEAATGDPGKRFDAEAKLRNEYTKNISSALDTREAYRRVQASKDDAVGDLSLIFGYMKMLDPGSVVREGEFANAQNAAGVPERVANLYNRIAKGERLTGGQRKSFIEQAGKLNAVAERRMDEEKKKLGPVIKTYGLDQRNVFGEQPADEPSAAAASASSAGQPKPIKTDADYAALPSGSTFIAPDGTTRRKP